MFRIILILLAISLTSCSCKNNEFNEGEYFPEIEPPKGKPVEKKKKKYNNIYFLKKNKYYNEDIYKDHPIDEKDNLPEYVKEIKENKKKNRYEKLDSYSNDDKKEPKEIVVEVEKPLEKEPEKPLEKPPQKQNVQPSEKKEDKLKILKPWTWFSSNDLTLSKNDSEVIMKKSVKRKKRI